MRKIFSLFLLLLAMVNFSGCASVDEKTDDSEIFTSDEEDNDAALAAAKAEKEKRFVSSYNYDNQKYQIQTSMQDVHYNDQDASVAEKNRIAEKWRSSKINEYWREYRGNFIKVQTINNNRDLREMRLIFKRGTKQDAFVDGDIADIIDKVSKDIVKETCGRKAKTNVIVYNKPSLELIRPSPFYEYEVVSSGAAVREIGFKCVY
jgi:hypothetical protein